MKGYFIQYKFIIPDQVKHSSYSYQKLFRALYGYTQAVDKSSGKRYKYHRSGVLSEVPHIRPRKNCVIIPPEHFQGLIEFFKTGRNPAHTWRGKGDWKATYYMDEKIVSENDVIFAIEAMVEKNIIYQGATEPTSINSAVKKIASGNVTNQEKAYTPFITQKVRELVNSSWFKEVYSNSPTLSEVYSNYKQMKETATVK